MDPRLLHNKFSIYSHPIPVLFPPFSYFCPQRTLGGLVKTIEIIPPNKRLHTFRSYVLSVMTEEIIPPHGSFGARSRPPPSPKTNNRMTARIDKHLEAYLKTCFPDRSNGIRAVYRPGSWQSNRYLQVPTILTADRYLHYEYCGGFVELHLEGKYQTAPFASFARRLREKTSDDSRLTWHSFEWP